MTARLDLRAKWFNGARLAGCNLSRVDLSGVLLEEADLEGANLRGTSLYGARLVRCKLAHAELHGARINGDKNAVFLPIDDFDATNSGASAEIQEVLRLSISKGPEARTFKRPTMDLGGMAYIPGGVFMMGTNARFAQPYEKPPRPIKVEPFYLDSRPVTNEEFSRFVRANPEWRKDAAIDRFGIPYYLCYWQGGEPPEGKETHPVVYVSWYAAAAYAAWRGKRLPTEAEWEYALRDGNHDSCWNYPYGDTPETGIDKFVRTQFQRAATMPAEQRTLDVVHSVDDGRLLRQHRLVDMTGNVNEWVADWFAEDHAYFAELLRILQARGSRYVEHYAGPEAGVRKVIRGGSYLFESDQHWTPFATFYRRPLPPINTNQDCGFRCALGASEYVRRVGRGW